MTVQTLTPLQDVSKTIMSMKPEFEEMLRNTGVDPDRFTRCAIMAIQQTPTLLECTKPSLYKAVYTCARWGLIPDGQEAAIVNFGKEAVAIDMVEGILKQVRNSGECGSIDAQVVFEKDTYESWIDEKGPHFRHVKSREKDRGKAQIVYANFITKDCHTYFEELTEEDVMAIRNIAKTKMIWDGGFKYEMWKKSAIRRLSKRLPKSTDIEQAMDIHDEGFDLNPSEPEKKTGEEQTTSSRLGKAIDTHVESAKSETTAPVQEPPDAAWREQEHKQPDPVQERNVDAPLPAQEGPQPPKVAQGVITNIKIKSAPPGTKPYWTRYGAQIDANWFGTFDKNIYNEMDNCSKNRILCEITYTETVKDNKVYFEAKAIRQLTATDMNKNGDQGAMPF